ncbi:transcriptional regulator [Pseudocitrobacter faecalis]
MRFLFNKQVIFDADSGTLFLADTPDDAVQISNPTKRLLLLLTCHQGEVINREIIFKKVWDDFGMVSSNNNLNHCISKLRRILRNLGLEEGHHNRTQDGVYAPSADRGRTAS